MRSLTISGCLVSLLWLAACSGSSKATAADAGGTGGTPGTAEGNDAEPAQQPDAARPPEGTVAPPLAGLWDGVSVTTGDGTSDPCLVIIDDAYNAYLTNPEHTGRGMGTVSAAGDVVISVSGAGSNGGGITVTYAGHIAGDSGSGTWNNVTTGVAGTWTATRRKGVTVPASAPSMCADVSPCMSNPNAAPDPLTVVDCMFAVTLPSPVLETFSTKLAACIPAASCDALWACWAKGSLTTVYVAPTGSDSNDGATPGTPKKTLNAAIAATQADGIVLVATGIYQENVFINRPLTLAGGYDVAFTAVDLVASPVTIDAGGLDVAITAFVPGPAPRVVLKAIKVTNGFAGRGMGMGGGGVQVTGVSDLVLEDCTLSGNHATGNGGGVQVNNAKLTVKRCAIENNTADGNAGGGIDVNNGTLTVSASTIRNNRAGQWGGGINTWQSEVTIADTTITGNTPNNVSGTYSDLGGNTVSSP
jgi:hypothetical protein